jgi:hypothetical protein
MRAVFCFSLAFVLAPGLTPSSAVAARQARDPSEKVADVLKGRIVIMLKRAPARFANPSSFIRFLQANRKQHIWPDKNNKKEWRFEFMAFYARPLNDLEVTVKFYDVTEGKKFVAADTFYTPQKGQRILASSMTLNKPRFEVNRKYQMYVLSARQAVLASTEFWLRGEKEHYSGRVTFTDDETKVKDD